ncbi:MAG TPA: N-acetyltransferase [Pirellulaceae bacterium]|nr:N-acetyltransferase [Pirellulaceae bacterium]
MITIRPECSDDAAAIHAVHVAAFPAEDVARLVDALRAAGHARISLVAEIEGQIVGHVVFSPVTVDGSSSGREGPGLAPVAVLPGHQRRGIGSALIREGLAISRQHGYGFVVLLGHPEYYPRFGFRRGSDFGLANEYGADEAFMVLELVPGSLPPGGLVRYGPEFGQWS